MISHLAAHPRQEKGALIGFDTSLTTNLAPHFPARSNIPPRLSPSHRDGASRIQTSGKHPPWMSASINFTFRSQGNQGERDGEVPGKEERGGKMGTGGGWGANANHDSRGRGGVRKSGGRVSTGVLRTGCVRAPNSGVALKEDSLTPQGPEGNT